MRLSSIGLRNFKCFRAADVELAPLTVLAGLNSSGKSSLIQPLLLLRQSQTGTIPPASLRLTDGLTALGEARDVLHHGADEDVIGFALEWSDGRSATWRFAAPAGANVLRALSAPDLDITGRAPFSDHFAYLSADRVGPRTSYPADYDRVVERRDLGRDGAFTAHFLERQVDHPDQVDVRLLGPGSRDRSLRGTVEAWLGHVSRGVRVNTEWLRGTDLVQLSYEFADPQTGVTRPVRPPNVGYGVSSTLSVIVAVLAAKPGGLVIIENPEAHLHPRGQYELTDLLVKAAAAGIQIIVETHSDHVLNAIRVAARRGEIPADDVRLHFLERNTDGRGTHHEIISPLLRPDGRLSEWPEGFFDQWDIALGELLRPADGPE